TSVGSPRVGHGFHIGAIQGGFQDVHLSFAKQAGVVVGRRSTDQNVVALGGAVKQVFRLQLADLDVVERNVEVQIAISDDAVISEHWNILATGAVPHRGGNLDV